MAFASINKFTETTLNLIISPIESFFWKISKKVGLKVGLSVGSKAAVWTGNYLAGVAIGAGTGFITAQLVNAVFDKFIISTLRSWLDALKERIFESLKVTWEQVFDTFNTRLNWYFKLPLGDAGKAYYLFKGKGDNRTIDETTKCNTFSELIAKMGDKYLQEQKGDDFYYRETQKLKIIFNTNNQPFQGDSPIFFS